MSNGGPSAIKGFLYQFLYSVFRLIERPEPGETVRVCAEDDWRLRVEGVQDLEEREDGRLRLVQLKDRDRLPPAEFAEDVLRPFAQFGQLRSRDVEFALVTSAELRGRFWNGFLELCDKLREYRRIAPPGGGSDLRPVLCEVEQEIQVDRAAIWSVAGAQAGEQRGLPKAGASEFVGWFAQSAFMQAAGLGDGERTLDFLSRIEVVPALSHERLRYQCLQRIVTRVPQDADGVLNQAVGALWQWAGSGDREWRTAEQLLAELGLPAIAVTWPALKERCPNAMSKHYPLAPTEEGPYCRRPVYEGLFEAFVRDLGQQRRAFVMASRGPESKSRLMRRFAQIAALWAPTFALDARDGEEGFARCLRQLCMGVPSRTWSVDGALARLHETRPAGAEAPSFVVLCDHFGDGDIDAHCDLANRLSGHAKRYDGLFVLAGRRAAFSAVRDASFLGDIWHPASEHPQFTRDAPWQPTVDMDRQPWDPDEGIRAEPAHAVVRRVAEKCCRTEGEVRSSVGLLLDIARGYAHGVVPNGQPAGPVWWEWGSTAPTAFPQAAVDAGLFDRRRDGSLCMVQSPTCAGVVRDWIATLPRDRQVEMAKGVAQEVPTNWALMEGFALWFASIPQTGPEGELAREVHGVFASAHLSQMMEQVYAKQEATALSLLWPIALERYEELSASPTARPLEREHAVRRVLQMIAATNATAEEKLRWALRTLAPGTDRPTAIATTFLCRALGGSMIERALGMLEALPPFVETRWPSGLHIALATAVAARGPEALGAVLAHLRDNGGSVIPLAIALGEIGDPGACEALEALRNAHPVTTFEGRYVRQALVFCGAPSTADMAREALAAEDVEALKLRLWITRQGAVADVHPQAAAAASRLASAGVLSGDHLGALAVCRESASDESWEALRSACEIVLDASHSVWVLAPMLATGLPEAPRMLLGKMGRLWEETGEVVGGVSYGMDALCEEPLTPRQIADVAAFCDALPGDSPVLQALRAAAQKGSRRAFDAIARVSPSLLEEVCRDGLQSDKLSWGAAEVARYVRMPELADELAAHVGDDGLLGIHSVQALCAAESDEAFNTLVAALRGLESVQMRQADALAVAATRLGRISDCVRWALDEQEAKCLRQAATLALGVALRDGVGDQDSLLEVLGQIIACPGELAYCASLAAATSGHPGLFERLSALCTDPEYAFYGLHGCAYCAADDALPFLLEVWPDIALYDYDGEATCAVCVAAGRRFSDPGSRTGALWDRCREWLPCAVERFFAERGKLIETGADGRQTYTRLGTDQVLADSILGLAKEWMLPVCLDTIGQLVIDDGQAAWVSSPERHLRWAILAQYRPEALVEVARAKFIRALSEKNQPPLAEALLLVDDSAHSKDAWGLVVELALGAKAEQRYEIARHVARHAASRTEDLPLDAGHAPFIRDIASVTEDDSLADRLLRRLGSSSSPVARRAAQRGREARSARLQADEAWGGFLQEKRPHVRLWWCNALGRFADHRFLEAPDERMRGLPLSARFALQAALDQAEARAKDAFRTEDRNREGDRRPWLWDT